MMYKNFTKLNPFLAIVLFILLLLLVGGCIAAYMWVPMFRGKVDQQWKRMTGRDISSPGKGSGHTVVFMKPTNETVDLLKDSNLLDSISAATKNKQVISDMITNSKD